MSVKLDSQGKRTFRTLEDLDKIISKQVNRAAYQSGKQMITYAKQKMLEKPKTGRTYLIRTKTRKFSHTASNANVQPPEFPAALNRNLLRSMDLKVKGADTLTIGAGASKSGTGNASRYAKILEDGGQAGRGRKSRIKGRKYLQQTIDDNMKDLTTTIEEYVWRSIK